MILGVRVAVTCASQVDGGDVGSCPGEEDLLDDVMTEKAIAANDDDTAEIAALLSSHGLLEGRAARDMSRGSGGWRLRGNV